MKTSSRTRIPRIIIWVLVLALVSIIAYKGYRIYAIAQRTYADVQRIQNMPRSFPKDPAAAAELGNVLASLQTDLELARVEFQPFFPIMRGLTWLPRFSAEAVYAEELFEAGIALLETGRYAMDAAQPALTALSEDDGSLLDQAPAILQRSSAPLADAAEAFERYQTARSKIPTDELDPLTGQAFSRLDALTPSLTNAFQALPELPALLGMPNASPILSSFNKILDNKEGATYLLIFQNEDELRATGGFVTAIGTLKLIEGKPSLGHFSDSPAPDDLSNIYPPPPWWLKQYMRADYLLLRDANWEIDYPQASLTMAYLYGYADPTQLSGVISFDQQAIVRLLRLTGPLEVAGFDEPVSAENLVEQLRAAKSVDAAQFGGVSGQRKAFLEPIAYALMEKLLTMLDADHAGDLFSAAANVLDEKHALVSVFTPGAEAALRDHGWNGSVTATAEGDTLMVVDSNIGFNKTNALVARAYNYAVDLSNLSAPTATLTVEHTHNGGSERPCQQWGADNPQTIREYPMERCYYNYLRVVTPQGTLLTGSQTHSTSGLIIGGTIPARVDALEERIEGARVWGTLMALPGYSTLTNRFEFALPASVVRLVMFGVESGWEAGTAATTGVGGNWDEVSGNGVGTGSNVSDSDLGSGTGSGSDSDPGSDPGSDFQDGDPNLGYAKSYSARFIKQPGTAQETVTLSVRLPVGANPLPVVNLMNVTAVESTFDPATQQTVITFTILLATDTTITVLFE